MVNYAAIMNDKHRAAGRSGVGAVMGSKNLKAVAIRGTGGVKVADPAAFREAALEAYSLLKQNPVSGEGLPALAPCSGQHYQSIGSLPTRNFQQVRLKAPKQFPVKPWHRPTLNVTKVAWDALSPAVASPV